MSSLRWGYDLNLIVLINESLYFLFNINKIKKNKINWEKTWAASISIWESPKHIKLVIIYEK